MAAGAAQGGEEAASGVSSYAPLQRTGSGGSPDCPVHLQDGEKKGIGVCSVACAVCGVHYAVLYRGVLFYAILC